MDKDYLVVGNDGETYGVWVPADAVANVDAIGKIEVILAGFPEKRKQFIYGPGHFPTVRFPFALVRRADGGADNLVQVLGGKVPSTAFKASCDYVGKPYLTSKQVAA